MLKPLAGSFGIWELGSFTDYDLACELFKEHLQTPNAKIHHAWMKAQRCS